MSYKLARPAPDFDAGSGLLVLEQFQMAYVTNDIEQAGDLFRKRFGIREFTRLEGKTKGGGFIRADFAWASWYKTASSGPRAGQCGAKPVGDRIAKQESCVSFSHKERYIITADRGCTVFKQICFFRKHPDMSMDEFMDYYENQHSQLSKRQGRAPSIPNAVRYVRRYLKPEKNPVTGEVHDPGYDCIMEIWWNSREDFENSQKIIASPDRIDAVKEDETKLFASHANPVCSVVEYDSPMGPNGEMTHVELTYSDEARRPVD